MQDNPTPLTRTQLQDAFEVMTTDELLRAIQLRFDHILIIGLFHKTPSEDKLVRVYRGHPRMLDNLLQRMECDLEISEEDEDDED